MWMSLVWRYLQSIIKLIIYKLQYNTNSWQSKQMMLTAIYVYRRNYLQMCMGVHGWHTFSVQKQLCNLLCPFVCLPPNLDYQLLRLQITQINEICHTSPVPQTYRHFYLLSPLSVQPCYVTFVTCYVMCLDDV